MIDKIILWEDSCPSCGYPINSIQVETEQDRVVQKHLNGYF